MKKLAVLFIFFGFVCKGQTDDEDHRKYWYYRTRLVNDFMLVGPDPGMSIPFNQRGLGYDGNIAHTDHVAFKAGDGSAKLGVYIGVLATEYTLIRIHGQNTEKVIRELYYALNAFNRLDHTAEGL